MLNRPFSILPIQVVPYEGPWLVDFEFKTWELYAVLYMQYISGQRRISFSEAYRMRWFEQARQDPYGRYWLINSRSIRTRIHIWAQERNFFIEIMDYEITFPKSAKLPK